MRLLQRCLSFSLAQPFSVLYTSTRPLTVRSPSSFSRLRSLLSLRASSRCSQEWLSRRRCLPQKWPPQKPQSPTMRWAKALQPEAPHRGPFFFNPPVVVFTAGLGGGFAWASDGNKAAAESSAAMLSLLASSSALLPLVGRMSSRVEAGGMW